MSAPSIALNGHAEVRRATLINPEFIELERADLGWLNSFLRTIFRFPVGLLR